MSWPRDAVAEAVWQSDLPSTARLVVLAYCRRAGRKECVYLRLAELCEMTGAGEAKARAGLRAAVKAGWLVEIKKAAGHHTSTYRLAIPQGFENRTPSKPDKVARSPKIAPDGSENRAPRGAEIAPPYSSTEESSSISSSRAREDLDSSDPVAAVVKLAAKVGHKLSADEAKRVLDALADKNNPVGYFASMTRQSDYRPWLDRLLAADNGWVRERTPEAWGGGEHWVRRKTNGRMPEPDDNVTDRLEGPNVG